MASKSTDSQKFFNNWWNNVGKEMANKTGVKNKNICNICRNVFTKGYNDEVWQINEKYSTKSDLDKVINESYKAGVKIKIINLSRKIDGICISFV